MTQSALPDDDPIRDLHETFFRAMRTGDISPLAQILAEDVVFMPPADCTLYGKREVHEWFQDYVKHFTILSLEETERAVSPFGDVLVERMAVSVKLEPKKGGMPIYDDARILHVWRRTAGSWTLWHSMWNSVKPIGAGTNRFLVRFMQGRDD